MRKSTRYSIFLVTFLAVSISARSQYFKPVWVNDIGGTGDSKATNITADNTGDIYISGYIRGTVTFNLKQGGTQKLTSNGDADIYIAKYSIATGNYVWAISMGGSGIDLPNSMTIDKQGNVLVTGQFQSTVNFNPKGSFPLSSNGSDDIFITKFTSDGDFVWATSMGSTDIDRGHYITTDNQNNILITASYTGAVDVDPSAAVHNLPNQNTLACFFAKYDQNGNFLWAHPLGNVNPQNLTSVAVDKTTNDIVVAGDFSGNVDFSYSGIAGATFNSPAIADFIARYTNDGTYKWVDYLPGSGSSIMSSVNIDSQSNIIITGSFGGQFYPSGPSGTSITAYGSSDVLVASYTGSGTLNWANHYGSANSTVSVRYVTTNGNNNIFIAGYFSGTINIPSLSNVTLTSSNGGSSVLIAGFTSTGVPLAAGAIGSSCTGNTAYEIAADNSNVYVAGSFCQTVDFDTGNCLQDPFTSVNSTSDSFLASFAIANVAPDTITAFSIPQQISPAVIDQVNHTISVEVAPGTNVTALTPSVTVSNSGTINPSSGTAQDFTSPVVYTANSGCISTPYTVKVTLYVTKIDTTCSASTNTITGDAESPAPGGYAWQVLQNNVWVSAPGTFNTQDYQTSALINNTNADVTYQLRRQISVGGNTDYDSFYNVTVMPAQLLASPVVTVDSVTSTSLTFQWDAVSGATGYKVSIDNGQTFTDPSSGNNGLTQTLTGLQPEQSITIIVQAMGNAPCQVNGNSSPVTGTTKSLGGDLIYVPNAFTPNADGKNDIVYVHSENIQSLKFYIYDQWGELLYTSLSQQNGWDGTYRGKKEPVGVYVYYLEAIMNDGQHLTKKGTITLIR